MKKYFLVLGIWLYSTLLGYSQCLKLDIVLVGDLSGSIIGHEVDVQQAFKSFVDRFELSEETIRIGMVVFSDYHAIASSFSSDKPTLYSSILHMFNHPLGSATNINAGLKAGYEMIMDEGRFDVTKIIITISDGGVNKNLEELYSTIELIKSDPNTISCGILIQTRSTWVDIMKLISENYCYVATDYSELQQILMNMSFCF